MLIIISFTISILSYIQGLFFNSKKKVNVNKWWSWHEEKRRYFILISTQIIFKNISCCWWWCWVDHSCHSSLSICTLFVCLWTKIQFLTTWDSSHSIFKMSFSKKRTRINERKASRNTKKIIKINKILRDSVFNINDSSSHLIERSLSSK